MIELQMTIDRDRVEILIHNRDTGNNYRLNKQYFQTCRTLEERAADIATKIAEYLVRIEREP